MSWASSSTTHPLREDTKTFTVEVSPPSHSIQDCNNMIWGEGGEGGSNGDGEVVDRREEDVDLSWGEIGSNCPIGVVQNNSENNEQQQSF